MVQDIVPVHLDGQARQSDDHPQLIAAISLKACECKIYKGIDKTALATLLKELNVNAR